MFLEERKSAVIRPFKVSTTLVTGISARLFLSRMSLIARESCGIILAERAVIKIEKRIKNLYAPGCK